MFSRRILFFIIFVIIVSGSFLVIYIYLIQNNETEEVKEVKLTLTEVTEGQEAWVPSIIYLNRGDNVELTVVNGDDEFEHSLTIPDLDIQTEKIPPANNQIVIHFKVEKTGNFQFNDPESPINCEPIPPEEISKRDMVRKIKMVIDNLLDVKSLEEKSNLVDQLYLISVEYKSIISEDILNVISELKEINSLGNISNSVNDFINILEIFEESLAPPCIEPGQIIVEE